MINSRFLDGMTIEAAKNEVAKRLETPRIMLVVNKVDLLEFTVVTLFA